MYKCIFANTKCINYPQRRRKYMILACHGIQKSFGEHLIVRDGSFHIEDHEKAALVGPNGAGKSTLLKMIVAN